MFVLLSWKETDFVHEFCQVPKLYSVISHTLFKWTTWYSFRNVELADEFDVKEITQCCIEFLKNKIQSYEIFECPADHFFKLRIFKICYTYRSFVRFVEYLVPYVAQMKVEIWKDQFDNIPHPVLLVIMQAKEEIQANKYTQHHKFAANFGIKCDDNSNHEIIGTFCRLCRRSYCVPCASSHYFGRHSIDHVTELLKSADRSYKFDKEITKEKLLALSIGW